MLEQFPVQKVLELACAAQRTNEAYIKVSESVYDASGSFLFIKHSNKDLIRHTLGISDAQGSEERTMPALLRISASDVEQAEDILKYFRRLMFAAVTGENEFQIEVNSLLESEMMPANKLGFIACLPSVYARDVAQNKVKKAAQQSEEGFLAEIGAQLRDLDAEIISSVKSKNFEGYNIDAIINNKMASWMNKTNLELGPAVIVKAKVKDFNKHWKYQNDVTRLHFVKAAQ
jgi:hypothetical protein